MKAPLTATYGHGTENDFVILFDPDDENNLSSKQTAAICNRASGIGADGLIRVIKRDGKWFMDYRNADGSLAEMCGNGIRVRAKYLSADVAGDISVNMGQVEVIDGEITAANNGKVWSGYNLNIGNPHAVVFVDSLDDVGDLKDPPVVRPKEEYPEGVNVEFVQFLENGELAMRVHERGSGETRSCGTGTCAVALAATLKKGMKLPAKWVINPPGGRLVVEIDPHSNATLSGPAVLIKDFDLEPYLG